jgi:hypothetical protein
MKLNLAATALASVLLSSASWALQQPPESPQAAGTVSRNAFFKPDLSISLNNVPLHQTPQARSMAWSNFFNRYGREFNVYLDSRSGTPTNVQGHVPLIPGDGVDNRVTLSDLSRTLGRPVTSVDADVVGEVVRRFVVENAEVFKMDMAQLGRPRVTQISETLWQLHFPQEVQGIPVRQGRLAATISHGNLVLIGTEGWGNVRVPTLPMTSADQALEIGLTRAGLMQMPGRFWKQPTVEIVPYAPAQHQRGSTFVGNIGEGYAHRLVWAFGFQENGSEANWEVSVDAHTGEVLSIEDQNQYVAANINGGVYPVTSTENCSASENCGTMQANYPMPWANTGLAAPNNYTNGAGVFDYTSGTVTTTLSGKYVRISDGCGAISMSSSTGNIAFGGVNGQHDCTSAGGSVGNTASARSSFYEVNKLAEMARGWLPSNTWLTSQLTANVNINSTCNAFWNGSTINFYRSGGGCRNTGEIAAVFDHEWGHGLDDFDANGTLSTSSEGYADIAAIYRLQTSCVGHGFFATTDKGCGMTADGTGYNQNEAQSGAAHCDLNCSGVRDADWARHSDNTPDTPQNFVCTKCSASTGLCGRQTHCAAAPTRQAAWDLVARDLRAAPYNYDSNTAFIVANKLFYQGSGNVGSWHACDCTAGTSNGCGSTNGYMQWLAADDDNGNLNDGTPHMTAIYAAFNRHNIACSTPSPVQSGCSTGPTAAPTLTATAGNGQVALSWNSVAGASKYWVMKTEGHAGCNFGKALVATATTTGYTDTVVASGRQYCYSIVGVGSSNACYGQASTCVCATPTGDGGGGGDTTAPTTSLTAPVGGATLSGIATVSANASDNVGVTKVDFYAGSTLIGSDTTSPYSISWDTTTVASSTYTLTSKAYDAAGNVGTSAGVSVTVSNGTGSCATTTQLFANPGFESGSVSWATTAGVIDSSTSYPARTGSWKAWLNGYGTTRTDYTYQDVTIPANACTARFSFWLRIDSAETSTTTAYDKLTVTVRNTANTVLATLATYSNVNESTSYLERSFDLAAYKGQTVRIYFNGTEDSLYQTSFLVDDAAVTITQ